jgi:hypothetical protein
MSIFTHWIRIEKGVVIGGAEQRLRAWGGSNSSLADAARAAERRLARVLERISTGQRPDESDEGDIREEALHRVNAGIGP